jgi:hypothetical protein
MILIHKKSSSKGASPPIMFVSYCFLFEIVFRTRVPRRS